MAELNLSDKSLADIVKLARTNGTVQQGVAGGVPFAVIPAESKVVDLSQFVFNEHNANPERKKGTAKVFDSASFCEYYTLFMDVNSRIFADETNDKILAVLDYHAAGENAPRWGQHRIDLTLRHSPEWTLWTGNSGQVHKMNQEDFALFIEDNSPDVIEPNGATMLEVARDLSASTDMEFGSSIRQLDGSVAFKYTEQTKGTFGKNQLAVPERFVISIPVHIGSERVSLTARLRYRIASGKLTFWYDLLRADAVERDAFIAVHAAIGQKLGVTIINGTPA